MLKQAWMLRGLAARGSSSQSSSRSASTWASTLSSPSSTLRPRGWTRSVLSLYRHHEAAPRGSCPALATLPSHPRGLRTLRSGATAAEVDVEGMPIKSVKSILRDSKPVSAPVDSPREWQRLGLNAALSTQLLSTHPHFERPTPTQRALVPSVLSKSPLSDLILRSHTGSGKSFGILLALLSKPRLVFHTRNDAAAQGDSTGSTTPGKPGISSILLVPTNELAMQYLAWARALFPSASTSASEPAQGFNIDDLVRASVRGGPLDVTAELKLLRSRPPHILICTPSRMLELLGMEGKKGSKRKTKSSTATTTANVNPTSDASARSILGLATLRTLVLDEADALLSLPPRFPSQKEVWKHAKHPPPGLRVLEEMMKLRPTCSGGEGVARNGLEMDGRRRFGIEQLPKEDVRRAAHKGRERLWDGAIFAPAKERLHGAAWAGSEREPWEVALQLVVTSATAGSVLRHFLGARTGWLRIESGGERDSRARWIDLTGLSGDKSDGGAMNGGERGGSARPSIMPHSLEHLCLVVDSALPGGVRNLRVPERREMGLVSKWGEVTEEPTTATESPGDAPSPTTKATPTQTQEESLLQGLATVFALRGTRRGLALIPPTWSLRRSAEMLRSWGVDVHFVPSGEGQGLGEEASGVSESSKGKRKGENKGLEQEEGEATLYLLQSTSARGLDIKNLDDVFILGAEAVGDAVQYTHLAGRVGRIGVGAGALGRGEGDKGRRKGCVITLLPPAPAPAEGTPHGEALALAPGEMRMAGIYKRLDVRLGKWKLRKEEKVEDVGEGGREKMEGREMEEVKDQEPAVEEGVVEGVVPAGRDPSEKMEDGGDKVAKLQNGEQALNVSAKESS